MHQRSFTVWHVLGAFLCICQTQFGACGLKISTLGDVIAGLPFTLTCKLNRTTGDTRVVTWRYSQEPYRLEKNIYSSWQCTASIQVSLTYPAGLSGSCQTVNGEESYSLTMQNATQATGQIRWRCLHGRYTSSIRLDVKERVQQVIITNPSVSVLAGESTNFTCVTSASKPQACIRGFLESSLNVRELDPRDCNQGFNIRQVTTRTLTFTPTMEDNGANLYCNASNNVTDPPVRSGVYSLDVQCVPKLTCTKTNVTVLTGQKVVLFCDIMSKPEANVIWLRNGKQIDGASSTYSRSLTSKYLATSELQLGTADQVTRGTYQVEATNGVGSARVGIELTVIEEAFLPDTIHVASCNGGQATLLWASGIETSLVEFYNLEYADTNKIWNGELVRNPGRVKLVKKTLTSLQPGVWYQFRVRPQTDPETPRYAAGNCTVRTESPLDKQTAAEGISNTGMLGVGVAVGVTFVTVNGLWVTCVLVCKKKLVWNSAKPPNPDGKINSRKEREKCSLAKPPTPGCYKTSSRKNEKAQPSKTECYESLGMTSEFGQVYEVMTGTRFDDTGLVYENSN